MSRAQLVESRRSLARAALTLAASYLNSGDAEAAAAELRAYRISRERLGFEPYPGADEAAAEIAAEVE